MNGHLTGPVRARPAPEEIAVIHAPAGGHAVVHTAAGAVEVRAAQDGDPLIAVVPGDSVLLGWGARVCRYGRLDAVAHGRHAADRAVWQQAAASVRGGGVAYVQMRLRKRYGRARWAAENVRYVAATPTR